MTPRIIVANLGVRLKSFYRERSAMFFTFAFPVILVLVFGTIFTKPEHLHLDLPVQDLSHSEGSARLLEALTAGDAFTIDRDGLTLVEAQDAATVCVMALHPVDVRRGPGRPRLAARIAAWLSSVGAAVFERRSAPYY